MEGGEINQVENLKIQSCSSIGESYIPIFLIYIRGQLILREAMTNESVLSMAIRLAVLKNTTFFII